MKKNYILSVVSVLLIVGIGFTFAYFMSGVNVSGDGSDVTVTPGDNMIEVEYDAGSEVVDVDGVVPGDIVTKEFDIIIRPTEIEKEATYAIKLDIDNNTFVKCDDSNYDSITNACTKDVEELVYRLKGNDNQVIAEGSLMNLIGEQTLIVETKEVDADTTYHYTLEIEFVETNADQNHNENKSFSGRVIVEFAEEGILLKDQILADNPTIDNSRSGEITGPLTENTTGTLFTAEDDYGTSYIYAGDVDNNWVSFAGFYWRIIRINGDESIRMIYSGDSSSGPVETGEETQIGTSAFNEQRDDNAYVGYMYGTPGSGTYEETHANINDSTIKTVLDNWYQSNLLSYSEYISSDVGFCNDRSVNITDEVWWADDTKLGYGTNATAYGPYGRLAINSNYRNVQIPSLKCSQARDYFTISGSSKGNHVLTYPVGLITSDEVILAGGFGGVNGSSSAHYLNTGQYYWTVSPSHYKVKGNTAGVYYVSSIGLLNGGWVYNLWGVRPVINLDKNVTISSGNGTIDSPYVVGA